MSRDRTTTMLDTTPRTIFALLCASLLTAPLATGCVVETTDDEDESSNETRRDAGQPETDTPPSEPDATPLDDAGPSPDTSPPEDTTVPDDTFTSNDATSPDAARDAGPAPDLGGDASGSGDRDGGSMDAGGPPPCVSSTPQAAADPSEMTGLEWTVSGTVGNREAIADDIEQGTFRVPRDGQNAYGANWTRKSPEKDGKIASRLSFRGVRYAATSIVRFKPTVLFLNPQGIQRVFVNGTPMAGDVYGHGDKRIPIALDNGPNRIVLQFSTIRTAKVETFETSDPVFFNKEDETTPELRVGSKTTQPVGVPVLNLSGRRLRDVSAKVVANQHFEATTIDYPSLAADTLTQLAFRLKPKSKWSTAGETIPVTLRLEACSLQTAIETTVELKTVERGSTFRRTFRSPIDGSVQYYGVLPPENYSPTKKYGLALALHGASVQGEGHTSAYSRKKWAYVVGPTNRRRYGFDWEEWGRFNGLASLDHAMETFNIDERRVYVTGHSMGGHGTWHFGVMDPDRFAAIGPSAGWASFYSYAGSDRPQGPVAGARAHSDTKDYLSNLSDRGAYIVHGAKDNNVPTQEGRDLRDALRKHTQDVKYHEEPGADHWWDGNRAEGTDCVDWPPLFDFFKNRKLPKQPELNFEFKSPGPYYSPTYDYVTIRARNSPFEDAVLTSEKTGPKKVKLTTQNVQAMDIDGAALQSRGIQTLVVDGQSQSVPNKTFVVGPQTEKHPGQTGPLNQVFRRPFCFVYPSNGSGVYRDYAAFLLSVWSIRGNGHGCALPKNRVTDTLRQERNLVYLGIETSKIPHKGQLPFSWNGKKLTIGSWSFQSGVSFIAFPQGDHMAASIQAAPGSKNLLFDYHPFSSRSGMPDYLVFSDVGGLALGFFDANWKFDSSLGGRR
jgi:poly(3-hydroxybutyrate) depolymerase